MIDGRLEKHRYSKSRAGGHARQSESLAASSGLQGDRELRRSQHEAVSRLPVAESSGWEDPRRPGQQADGAADSRVPGTLQDGLHVVGVPARDRHAGLAEPGQSRRAQFQGRLNGQGQDRDAPAYPDAAAVTTWQV